MKIKLLLLLIILISTCACAGEKETALYYGSTVPEDYVAGKFNPAKHPHFVNLKKLDIPIYGGTHYLRLSTARALKRMISAFNNEYPNVRLYVRSSTRSFYTQKSIWNAKFNGKRLVSGKKLNKSIPDTYKRSVKILEYSSMPGTSRHHWGTDIDFNSLVNSYYTKGEGKIIYEWLQQNAHRYGFYQVYTAGREGGYNEERWHWSYMPEASFYYREWLCYYAEDTSRFSKNAFEGSSFANELALYYVTEINPECKR